MASKKLTDLVVTAAMVSARRADDTVVYLYRGAPLPDGLAEGEAERLADLGMVGEHAVPVVAEPPRSTVKVNSRGRAPAGAARKAPAKTSSKSAADKAAEKAEAEAAAAEAAAAAAAANGAQDGGNGDPGDAAGDADGAGAPKG